MRGVLVTRALAIVTDLQRRRRAGPRAHARERARGARSAPIPTCCADSCARWRATGSSPKSHPASSGTPTHRSSCRKKRAGATTHISPAASGSAPAARWMLPARWRSRVCTAPITGAGWRRIPTSGPRSTERCEQRAEGRSTRLETVAWRGGETIVDVGGGNGSLLLALLERHPGMRANRLRPPGGGSRSVVFRRTLQVRRRVAFERVPPTPAGFDVERVGDGVDRGTGPAVTGAD